MRAFGRGAQGLTDLSPQDIDDIVAYIRQWSTLVPSPMTLPARRSLMGGGERSTRVDLRSMDVVGMTLNTDTKPQPHQHQKSAAAALPFAEGE